MGLEKILSKGKELFVIGLASTVFALAPGCGGGSGGGGSSGGGSGGIPNRVPNAVAQLYSVSPSNQYHNNYELRDRENQRSPSTLQGTWLSFPPKLSSTISCPTASSEKLFLFFSVSIYVISAISVNIHRSRNREQEWFFSRERRFIIPANNIAAKDRTPALSVPRASVVGEEIEMPPDFCFSLGIFAFPGS